MTELITTQPAGVAAILAALALVLTRFAPVMDAIAKSITSISVEAVALMRAGVDAIRAWTKRTNDERDCTPRLAAAEHLIEGLRGRIVELERALDTVGIPTSSPENVIEEHVREPSGEQRLPAGVPPRTRKGTRP